MKLIKKSKYINIYKFKDDDKYIIFHSYYGNIMKVNNRVIQLINYFSTPKTSKEYCNKFKINANEVEPVIKNCIDKKFLIEFEKSNDLQEIELIKTDDYLDCYPERLLRFYITKKCNMRCSYCFESKHDTGKDMTLATVKNGLEAFNSFLDKETNKNYELIKINFFGGEPLIKFDLIKTSYDLIYDIVKQKDKRLKITINTNGTLLNREKINWIISHNVHLYLSIDGLKEQNDKNRILKNGQGTFDIVIKNLKTIIAEANEEYIEKHLTILVTVTSSNIKQVEQLVLFLESLGIKNISLNAAFNCILNGGYGTDWTTLSKEQIDIFIRDAIYLRDKMYNSNLHIGGTWGYIPNRLKKGGVAFCQAVGYEIGVSPNGDLFPCPCTFSRPGLSIGKLLGNRFQFNDYFEKWQQRKVTNTKTCIDCPISGICRGGCPGVSVLNDKDIYMPQQCDFWRKFVDSYVTNVMLTNK